MLNPSHLNILIICQYKEGYHDHRFLIQRWVSHTLEPHVESGQICIRIVDEEESQQLNNQYRSQDKPTNILSFPYEIPKEVELDHPIIGDLVVCAPVVEREAEDQEKTLESHWAHMVIHGTLHLLGYDHITDNEAAIMESLEIQLMKELGYGKAYRYAHDEPEAYAAGEQYFPDGMGSPEYYRPVDRGLEIKIAEKLAHLRENTVHRRHRPLAHHVRSGMPCRNQAPS